MFKIGDFSKLTFVSIRMLRYYDEIDLFKPHSIDSFTNYRYYSASQIPLLNKILYLRDFGLKADEIRVIINETDKSKQLSLLNEKKKELKAQISSDQRKLKELNKYIKNYNVEERKMKHEIIVKEVPSFNVVTLRETLKAYTDEGELWGKIMPLLYKNQVELTGMCYAAFPECDNDDTVVVEIGLEVSKLQDNTDGLTFKELPTIPQAATLLVQGDYSPTIQEGYNQLATWLEQNNYQISGTSRTVYIKGPEDTKDPSEYLTDIIIPIKKT